MLKTHDPRLLQHQAQVARPCDLHMFLSRPLTSILLKHRSDGILQTLPPPNTTELAILQSLPSNQTHALPGCQGEISLQMPPNPLNAERSLCHGVTHTPDWLQQRRVQPSLGIEEVAHTRTGLGQAELRHVQDITAQHETAVEHEAKICASTIASGTSSLSSRPLR